MGLYLDIEDADGYKASHNIDYHYTQELAVKWLDALEDITAKGIYASHSWLNEYMNVDELIEHGALIWEAHWNNDGKICEDKFAISQESSDYYLNDGTRVDFDIMRDDVFDRLIKANEYDFKANGQAIKFKGFMTLYVEGTDAKEVVEDGMLPELEEGNTEKLVELDPKQSFTEPPARYTEASLVKALEEKGIGRPSTYSPTITTILERRYIEKVQKQLMPTELGKIVNKLLTENFTDVINVEFTAKIENEFDEISEGKAEWKKMIRDFYGPFSIELDKVEKELEHVELVDEVSDVPCEKCGRMMVYKYGKYGKFLACPGYPECKNAKPIIETIDVPCPKCGGTVQVRKTKRRKNYYICENNPTSCDYISWNKPKKGEKWDPEEAKNIKSETKPKTRKRTVKKSKTTKGKK